MGGRKEKGGDGRKVVGKEKGGRVGERRRGVGQKRKR